MLFLKEIEKKCVGAPSSVIDVQVVLKILTELSVKLDEKNNNLQH